GTRLLACRFAVTNPRSVRDAIFTDNGPLLPADLNEGRAHHFAVVGVDVFEPAFVIAKQLAGRPTEQGFAGGTNQRHLGSQIADRARPARPAKATAVDDHG